MSDTILTEPIVLDETGQLILAKLDEIVSALNPNAQGVSFDKTGCEIITANNVQGALTQLDSGLDNTNASLTNLIKTTHFSGTTDTAGNIQLKDEQGNIISNANNLILSANSTSGYCTNALPSGSGYYVKILTGTSTVTPLVSTNTTVYVTYVQTSS